MRKKERTKSKNSFAQLSLAISDLDKKVQESDAQLLRRSKVKMAQVYEAWDYLCGMYFPSSPKTSQWERHNFVNVCKLCKKNGGVAVFVNLMKEIIPRWNDYRKVIAGLSKVPHPASFVSNFDKIKAVDLSVDGESTVGNYGVREVYSGVFTIGAK